MAMARRPVNNILMKYSDTVILSTEKGEEIAKDLVDHINKQKQNGRQLSAKLLTQPGQIELDIDDAIKHTVSVLVLITDDFKQDNEAKFKYFGALQDTIDDKQSGTLTVIPVYVPDKNQFLDLLKLPSLIRGTKHLNADFSNIKPFFDKLQEVLRSENALTRRQKIIDELQGDHHTGSEIQDLSGELERARIREDGCHDSEKISIPVQCTERD